MGTFKDNTAHSNTLGIRLYQVGFNPPEEALFEGIRSYYNTGRDVGGLYLHGISNIRVKDAFFAHNYEPDMPHPPPSVLYFGNPWGSATIEDSTFIGACGEVGDSMISAPQHLPHLH